MTSSAAPRSILPPYVLNDRPARGGPLGFAAACGFTVKSQDDLVDFTKKIKIVALEALAGIELQPRIIIEVEINLADINDELVISLEKFEPFGENNEKPKFLTRAMIVMDKISMGAASQHIKFRFGQMWAVAFNQAENYKDYKIGDQVDVVYYLEFNNFNGRRSVQMKIVDMKKG